MDYVKEILISGIKPHLVVGFNPCYQLLDKAFFCPCIRQKVSIASYPYLYFFYSLLKLSVKPLNVKIKTFCFSVGKQKEG